MIAASIAQDSIPAESAELERQSAKAAFASIAYDLIDENSYSSLVYKIYKSLTDVYGFYIAYVDELISESFRLMPTVDL